MKEIKLHIRTKFYMTKKINLKIFPTKGGVKSDLMRGEDIKSASRNY